ncbi:MAG: hypothetical protein IJI16_02110 [Atopobiaceae bacterium]|nr:hypothetical protein [Atopobiaceae bacterium]
MSKRILAFLLVPVLCLGIAACGGEPAAPQEAEPEQQAAEQEVEQPAAQPLDDDAILDVVEEACPIRLSAATGIKLSGEQDGVRTVTFGSEYGDFSYTIDAFTGQIVDKVEPQIEAGETDGDPVVAAISACFATLDGFDGTAENVVATVSGEGGEQYVEVTFDWRGESYDMVYDIATGEITQK